jgi:ATP-binding cassette subfamily B protein
VERQAERAAFAKACAYLNYSPAAKWTAHVAAIGTGVVYVALLVVLWLFADLMVSRGRLPRYEDLTSAEEENFHQRWSALKTEEQGQRLRDAGALGYKITDKSLAALREAGAPEALLAPRYQFTGKALADLRKAGLPEAALSRLEKLRTEYGPKDDFKGAVTKRLADGQAVVAASVLGQVPPLFQPTLAAGPVPYLFDLSADMSVGERPDLTELGKNVTLVLDQAVAPSSLYRLKDKDLPTEESFEGALKGVAPEAEVQRFHDTLLNLAAAGRAEADSPGQLETKWKAFVRQIIVDRVSPDAVPSDWRANVGIASLIVREDIDGRYVTPVLAWMARWSPWMWNYGQPTSVFPPYLIGLLMVGIVLGLLGSFLTLLQREMSGRATTEAATRLRRAVYHHTFRLGTLAFRALGPSEAISLFARHVEAVHDALYTRLTVMVREPVKLGLLLVFALVLQFWLAVAFLLFAVLVWLLGGHVASFFRRRGRVATHQAGERLTIMRESLMLMRLVKCYLMEGFNQARVERQLSRYSQTTLVRLRGEAIYQPLLVFLGLFCGLILLFFAGALVLGGEFSVASVVALATGLVSLYWPLEKVLGARRIIRRGQEAAIPVFKFLERRGEVGQVVGAEFLQPLHKQIEFDNVTLREPGSNRVLLEEVSLTIPAGHKVGIVGADDLEKHALVYLIPRLLDPSTGEIRIDQHNLRWVTLDSLRAQIGTVLMHNLVFHDTVANNIGCGDAGFKLPQIIEAAKIAHAHHFIQKLPQGYETPIGELGHPLSISEQFRIALARAILREPALLIIEEPEAALDEDTKALLDDTFSRILPRATCIFLPHRISTLRSCDTLHLLHKGRVIASGTHKELLSTNQLYRHQHYLEFAEVTEPQPEEREERETNKVGARKQKHDERET